MPLALSDKSIIIQILGFCNTFFRIFIILLKLYNFSIVLV
nr:MAG TPA: hypothetical protein [Caudoviricetes sp.]